MTFTNKLGAERAVRSTQDKIHVPLNVDGKGEPIYIWAHDVPYRVFRELLASAEDGWQNQ